MSFWDNVKKFAQPYDDEDYDDYDEELDDFDEPAEEPAPRTRRPSPFGSTASAAPAAPAAPKTEGGEKKRPRHRGGRRHRGSGSKNNAPKAES
jgi:hypothetical protein